MATQPDQDGEVDPADGDHPHDRPGLNTTVEQHGTEEEVVRMLVARGQLGCFGLTHRRMVATMLEWS